MIRFLLVAVLILLVAWALWRLVGGIIETLGGTTRRPSAPPSVKLTRDPVCGTWVQPREALALTAQGTIYYFCSKECREKFAQK